MPEKKVNVRVLTDVEDTDVDALEKQIGRIKREKLQLKIDAKTEELNEVEQKIRETKNLMESIESLPMGGFSQQTKELQSELNKLENKRSRIKLDIEDSELKQAKSEIDELDNEKVDIDVDVNNIAAMEAIDQLGQGFDRLKQGATEIGQKMGDALNAAGEYQMNQTFLEMNIGAEKAAEKASEIDNILRSLPGDDTILQGLMSSAVAKNANMSADSLKNMGSAAADYMAAMNKFGKTSLETQQDLNNYILAGNTGEIERSPILASHVDKLKEAKTVEERTLALQEALAAEGYKGIASQDIYVNNQQKFNDMLTRGQRQLGEMFLAGTDGAMKFLVSLDESTQGAVGLAFALGGMVSPITDSLMGLGQMATGLKSIKEAGDLIGLGDKLSTLKTALIDVGGAAKTAALNFLTLAKNALISGYNALKSAAMWVIQKAQLIASTIATYALSAAQAFLNIIMNMNPIMLVVLALVALAAAIVWAYYNVDWFRQMVDNAWASLVQIGQTIYSYIQPAIQWLANLFNQFTSQLGLNTNNWMEAILGFILFIPQLPIQIGIALVNAIAKALGFGNNFVQTMISAASRSVNGFVSWISQLPGKLAGELSKMLQMAQNFVMQIANILTGGAAGMVVGWITGSGEHSPGFMYEAFKGELDAMESEANSLGLSSILKSASSDMVHAWDPNLQKVSNLQAGTPGNQGDIIINIDNVNDEKQIDILIERLRRVLAFDNKTAGRTV